MRTYLVLTRQTDDGEPCDVIETRRTSKRAAEEDVCMLADVSHKKAWIAEHNDAV